ncbi:MAG: elongation factor G [Eubacteriales bacterium]
MAIDKTTNQIRNVCLLGHSGSGKTSVTEAMLYFTKSTDRMGKPADGNTVCDYDSEEIKRGFTLQTSIAPIIWRDVKINLIDTPGYLDFAGEVLQGISVADSSLIIVDAKSGIEVGTELAWDYATDAGIPKSFFINKFDDPDANFSDIFDSLREKFGASVCPVLIPMIDDNKVKGFINLIDMKLYIYDKSGKHTVEEIPSDFRSGADDYRNILLESIAETSEELMEKFFAEEEISGTEIIEAIQKGLAAGIIAPVVCGSSINLWSVQAMLDLFVDSYPTPVSVEGETGLFVFKTIADPFVGKMTFFRVMRGTLTNDQILKNVISGSSEKMAHIFTVRGKKQTEVDALACGDIGMIPKLSATNTNDTLAVNASAEPYKKIVYPEAFLTMAITPKAKGDEDKISTGINRLLEEDYTIKFENNAETKQLLISGMGDIHLDVITSKLKTRYGVGVEMITPKIAYRETIKKKIQVEGKHKKQSGGHGQYGHVRITFSPGEADGLTFTESVVGGVVPKNYFPAVEKGLLESMQKGVLAGFPMVHLAADLYDGSYHDVDSSEMAFKLAANLAYKELVKATPVVLEPVGELKVYIPDNLVGDVIGDLNKRRGRVLGMSAFEQKKGYQVVEAEAPKSEMTDYTIALRALSQGKGKFTFYIVRYEEVPALIAQKIIAEAKLEAEAEK